MLEQTDAGFAVQVPDLAISTFGNSIESAKQAAVDAIRFNIEAYAQSGKPLPAEQPVSTHLKNPDFQDVLFAYVEVAGPGDKLAA